ncbi:hypothetical protein FB451DRAFT_1370807 [Mycena latifolia]|nr:hypothetical protein FB451DRAFT_1370807 [Mycena latifolia]
MCSRIAAGGAGVHATLKLCEPGCREVQAAYTRASCTHTAADGTEARVHLREAQEARGAGRGVQREKRRAIRRCEVQQSEVQPDSCTNAQGTETRGEQRRINGRRERLDWQRCAGGVSNATSRRPPAWEDTAFDPRIPAAAQVYPRSCLSESAAANGTARVWGRKKTRLCGRWSCAGTLCWFPGRSIAATNAASTLTLFELRFHQEKPPLPILQKKLKIVNNLGVVAIVWECPQNVDILEQSSNNPGKGNQNRHIRVEEARTRILRSVVLLSRLCGLRLATMLVPECRILVPDVVHALCKKHNVLLIATRYSCASLPLPQLLFYSHASTCCLFPPLIVILPSVTGAAGPVPHGRDARVRARRCAPRRSPHRQDTLWRAGLLSPSPSFLISACVSFLPTVSLERSC